MESDPKHMWISSTQLLVKNDIDKKSQGLPVAHA